MPLCLSYKVDMITILEITVRLWRPNYHACSFGFSRPLCLSLTWTALHFSACSLSLSLCLTRLSVSIPVEPGSPRCDTMPSGAKLIAVTSQDHSHTVLAIHFLDMGMPAPFRKVERNIFRLAEFCNLLKFLSFICTPSFVFLLFPLTWAETSRVKWLYQLKSLILLSLPFKGSLFCTHRTTVTIQVACVQDFGGSKSIVGFPRRMHSCSSLEQPPDHTRRLTQNSGGAGEKRTSLPVIKYLLFAQLFLCLCVGSVKIWDIRKQTNERLTICWLLEV